MNEPIEIVKVKRDCPRGYKIINKSDFDPARHEMFDFSPEPEAPKRAYRKRGE
jgi:hypothetical protein